VSLRDPTLNLITLDGGQIMRASDIFSFAAFFVSLASLGVSWFVALRDRRDIVASAKESQAFHPVIVHIVNVGRRPITIKQLTIKTLNGEVFNLPVENRRLMESEFYEFEFSPPNDVIKQWSNSKIIKVQVEDSCGKFYMVKSLVELANKYVAGQNQQI